jgi:hypothetical protein
MASSNPLFKAARENDLWTRKKTIGAARQMAHRMNSGNSIKTVLRLENMPRQRSFEAPPEDWVAGWLPGKSPGSSPSYPTRVGSVACHDNTGVLLMVGCYFSPKAASREKIVLSS